TALTGYDWSAEWKSQWGRIEAEARSAGPKAANQLWLNHVIFAPARENAVVASQLTQMVTDYSGWHWVNKDLHREIKPPDSQRLESIKIPTLIVIGQRDMPDFHSISAILQERIPGASKTVLADAGHM